MIIEESTMLDEIDLEESNIFGDYDAMDVADLLNGITETYCDTMIEQCKDEFKTYVNEGSIESVNEGFVDKAQNFIKKIWAKIQLYFKKFLNILNKVFGNVYRFYKKNKQAIDIGCGSVEGFVGFSGLKSFKSVTLVNGLITKSAAVTRNLSNAAFGKDDSIISNTVQKVAQTISNNADVSKFDYAVRYILHGSESKVNVKYTPKELEVILGSETSKTVVTNSLKSLDAILKDSSNILSAKAASAGAGTVIINAIKKIISLQTRAMTHCNTAVKEIIAQANTYAHKALAVAMANGTTHLSRGARLVRSARAATSRAAGAIATKLKPQAEGTVEFATSEDVDGYLESLGIE